MTAQKIILRRGQVGTVVEKYKDGEAFEVEYPETAIKGIVKGVKLAFLEHINPAIKVLNRDPVLLRVSVSKMQAQ